jgi:hypothetical protein
MNLVPRLLHALALCVALLAAGEVAAAPLKVVGRFLQDTHGAYDIGIYPAAGTTSTSTTISGLPTDGGTLYVRLYSLISGVWYSRDVSY